MIEVRSGGSRKGEDEKSQSLADRHGYLGVGGSDAHIVSHIGRCATRFPREIRDERMVDFELVPQSAVSMNDVLSQA